MLKKMIGKLKYGIQNRAGFRRDERGNVMILTAFMTPLLMMGAATAIDMGEMYRAKTNFQVAVDAATLAFAKEFGKSASNNEAGISDNQARYDAALPIARAVFQANMQNLPSSTATIDFDIGNGDCNADGVKGVAKMNHEVFFPAFHKLTDAEVEGDKIGINGSTTVRCNNSTFEIALVLDNSGSMGGNSKIGTLRSSAITLVNRMFNGMEGRVEDTPLTFSVVPFAATVNVGNDNENASWMDTEGTSPVHHENLNWEDNPAAVKNGEIWQNLAGDPLTRFSLYDALDIEWEGCVEALPYPYSVQNIEPAVGVPESLIVPTFAPDTPDNWSGQYDKEEVTAGSKAICNQWQSKKYWYRGRRYTRTQRRCERWTDGVWNDRHPQDYSYRPERDDRIEYRKGTYIGSAIVGGLSWQDDDIIDEQDYARNNYIYDDHNFPITLGDPRAKAFTGRGADQHKRQKWTWKYFEDATGNHGKRNTSYGPNDACTTQALTPLTDDQQDVVNDLASMQASGATNIQQGVSWGWRTLTETEPLSGARANGTSGNRKIMIVMSDGNNTYYPSNLWDSRVSLANKSFYGAWGHSANGRLFDGFDAVSNPNHDFDTFRKAMDEHLAETCQNIKRDNITVYTIAFDVPNGSSVQTMLRNCASKDLGGSPLYIDAKNNAQLVAAFDSIYESLSELRISE